MDEKIGFVLELLSNDMGSTWVKDQLQSTFDEGITQRVSEQRSGAAYSTQLAATDSKSAIREQTKSKTYETTRSYSLDEQVDLLEFALRQVFVALTAVRRSALLQLKSLVPSLDRIEFVSDGDESGLSENCQAISSAPVPPTDSLVTSVQEFMRKVRSL